MAGRAPAAVHRQIPEDLLQARPLAMQLPQRPVAITRDLEDARPQVFTALNVQHHAHTPVYLLRGVTGDPWQPHQRVDDPRAHRFDHVAYSPAQAG